MKPDAAPGTWIESDVPARLDALGWSGWHRRVVIALGITWILDGLEASLIANLGPSLRDPRTLGLSAAQIGLSNSAYLAGQVLGALVFGHLTDRWGRKRLFLVTLCLYLVATALSGLAPTFAIFAAFRALAGAGIGGEYSAVNSAIDELIPARLRGQIDLGINGSYWIGVALGAGMTLVLLNPSWVPLSLGWRLVFGTGSILGLAILLVRRHVPESPRWLLMHGHVERARQTLAAIELEVLGRDSHPKLRPVRLQVTGTVGLRYLLRTLLVRHPRRTVLGLSL
ncbi:MAG TPA: MFS transporter, partial [Polyangiaceae bacterium]|nr:MFS transporter [Polyangiaceae bacterium]